MLVDCSSLLVCPLSFKKFVIDDLSSCFSMAQITFEPLQITIEMIELRVRWQNEAEGQTHGERRERIVKWAYAH